MAFHSFLRKFASPVVVHGPLCARQLVRPITPLQPFDQLAKAIHQIRVQQVSALPITDSGNLVGWVTVSDVAELSSDREAATDAMLIELALQPPPAVIAPDASLQEALAIMRGAGEQLLPVIDAQGCYVGCLASADLLAADTGKLTPPRIGGMATPLGVYLTTGAVSAGAGTLGLMLAGAMMAFMLWISQVGLLLTAILLYRATAYRPFAYAYRLIVDEPLYIRDGELLLVSLVTSTLLMLAFFLLLRFMPRMAGYHAAEHQTVNAIEAGEPLLPEIVSRMPRVHQRCGTNLWGIISLTYIGIAMVALVLATPFGRAHLPMVITGMFWSLLLIAVSWRRIGSWMQQHVTTRPATRQEIASGIRAGEDLLQRHAVAPDATPRPLQRVWNLGVIQVLIGALIAGGVLELCYWPLDYLVRSLVK